MKKISICIPCYNEEKNVNNAYLSVKKILQKLDNYDYEIIFADNSSLDGTEKIIREIASADKKVKAIINYKNYGPSRSTKNLLFAATGDAIIEIACDLQEPPQLIPEFIKLWEQGNKVVWGQKIGSSEKHIKFIARTLFYKIIGVFSSEKQIEHITGYGLMDKMVVQEIAKTNEREMPLRYIVSDLGFPITLIPYKQSDRKEGKSSYSVLKYWRFAINSLVRTSRAPLEIATLLGLISAFFSFVIGIVYLVYKLTHWYSFAPGIAPLVISIFFIGAIQLVFIGMLGEYIGVILDKVTDRPYVVEKERINFEDVDE